MFQKILNSIDLEKNVTFYELLFHIGTYNNELLSLHNGSGDSKAYGIFIFNCWISNFVVAFIITFISL